MVKRFNQQFRVGQGGIKEVSVDTELAPGVDQYVEVDATAGNVTLTLPIANGWGGKKYCIKKVDSSTNVVTIQGNGSQTIDGLTSVELIVEQQAIDLISDNENWISVGHSEGSGIPAVKSFVFATLSATQLSDFGLLTDHMKFDLVLESRGSDIVLDTSTPYATTLGAASIGRITLKAGKTYKITAHLPVQTANSTGHNMGIKLFDATAGQTIGKGATQHGETGTESNGVSGCNVSAIFKPTVDTLIELRFTAAVNITGITVENSGQERAPTIIVETI